MTLPLEGFQPPPGAKHVLRAYANIYITAESLSEATTYCSTYS
jgi:hypothetical protein